MAALRTSAESMRLKFSIFLIFVAASLSCASQTQNFKLFKLPSGREIKITGINTLDIIEVEQEVRTMKCTS
jgi:hypothetical protein